MSFYLIPIVHCDGPDCERPEINHPDARTVDDVRRLRREDGWHARPGGRDICPDCWAAGHR